MAVKSFTLSQIAWYRTMKEAFAQRGLDVDAFFQQCGNGAKPSSELEVGYLSDLFSCAWEMAVAQTGDPAIGLTKLAHPLSAFGMIAHMLLAAPDLWSAAQCLSRFSPLVSPTLAMDLVRDKGLCLITFTIAGGRKAVPMQRFDFLATVLLSGAQWITGRKLVPNVLRTPYPEPPEPGPWREAYGCPIEFSAECFQVEFDAEDFSRPIPTADPVMVDMCVRMTEQAAQKIGEHFTGKVRQEIAKLLAKGDPRREQVADMLCVSERTLQRRLSEEGTSFAELVDMVRRERAERLLAQGSLSATEMAFELGFSDPSNFYRACKRWFGLSPSSLRMGH